MLARRLRRRPNNKTTMGQCLVFAGTLNKRGTGVFCLLHPLEAKPLQWASSCGCCTSALHYNYLIIYSDVRLIFMH